MVSVRVSGVILRTFYPEFCICWQHLMIIIIRWDHIKAKNYSQLSWPRIHKQVKSIFWMIQSRWLINEWTNVQWSYSSDKLWERFFHTLKSLKLILNRTNLIKIEWLMASMEGFFVYSRFSLQTYLCLSRFSLDPEI